MHHPTPPCEVGLELRHKQVEVLFVRSHESPHNIVSQSTIQLCPSKSSRTMTKLSGRKCHNDTMKRVGCDPHVITNKAASLKRHPSNHMRANIGECHDAIE